MVCCNRCLPGSADSLQPCLLAFSALLAFRLASQDLLACPVAFLDLPAFQAQVAFLVLLAFQVAFLVPVASPVQSASLVRSASQAQVAFLVQAACQDLLACLALLALTGPAAWPSCSSSD